MIIGQVTLPDGRAARWQEAAGTADLLDGDWSQHVAALAALAHPARIRLLREVLHGATTAADLMRIDGMGTVDEITARALQALADCR